MKFGHNLELYSVPQWAPHNVAYNSVKKLIKEATSEAPVQAINIPGTSSDDELSAGLKQEIYLALIGELERIELFCKVKYGEIQRRLEHHLKLLDKANTRSRDNQEKRLRRIAKLEEGVIKAGNELQLLSRFIAANRLAFVKLLKKYSKWGGSSKVIERFRREGLDRTTFLNHLKDPLASLLAQYTSLLESVRAPFDFKGKGVVHVSSDPNFAAHDLQNAFQQGTQADFDAVFASSIPSPSGGRAIYWVHQDNLVQAHVLMQSVSNQRRASSADIPISPSKMTTSPLNTFGADWSGSGMIVCTELNNAKMGQINPQDCAKVFYTASDKAVTLSLPEERLTLKRKDVALLLQTDYSLPEGRDATAFNAARSWLRDHEDCERIIEVGYTRTRFAGFSNTITQGIWATLDTDIVIAKPKDKFSSRLFPHAILEIRWEGRSTPDVVRNLDRQVIAEKVPNFDIMLHAIATAYSGSLEPEWLKLLQTDLRHAAVVNGSTSDNKAKVKNSSDTTISDRPTSPFSSAQDHSSATSIPDISELTESLRRTRRENLKKKLHLNSPREPVDQSEPRYWNEFDNGEEDMQLPDAYTVEVYPDDDEDILVAMFSALGRKVKIFAHNLGLTREKLPEEESLLSPSGTQSSSSSDILSPLAKRNRGYSTFASHNLVQPQTPHAERTLMLRDRVLFHVAWIVYAIAAMFLVMSLVLETVGRKKYSAETRVVSVFGILMSFLLAALGITCGQLRDRSSIVGRSINIISFFIVCIADTILMVSIWQSSI